MGYKEANKGISVSRAGSQPPSIGSRSSTARRLLMGMLAVLLVAFAATGYGQQLTGTLSGTVTDQTGAAIPNAAITLKSQTSGDVRTSVADGRGFFAITAVQPSTYTLIISVKGFSNWQQNGIVMNLGDQRSIPNIKLAVASAGQQTVTVVSDETRVPLDSGEVSTTLTTQTIEEFPLAGRDAGELLKIMPGMTFNNGLKQGSGFGDQVVGSNTGPVGQFSSNGTQPNGSMAYMLDGANLTDPGNAGTQIANINADMTAQIKVLTNSYSAEYAKGPTIFEAFSKSGTSKYHGEAYLYAQNSALNSVDAYTKSQGGTNANQHFYYYGGNLGGPVKIPFTSFNKHGDKLFFWGGYEYMAQQPAGAIINYNVPTPAQLGGDFSNTGVPAQAISTWTQAYAPLNANLPTGVSSTFVPKSAYDPNILGVLKLYPKPNETPSSVNGWNNYSYVNQVPQNRWEATGKLDYAISDSTKLTGSYTYQKEVDQHPIAIWWAPPWTLPYASPVVAPTNSQVVMANLTHVFSPTTTNEFVFTLSRYINVSSLGNAKAVDRTNLGFNVKGLFGTTTSQIPNFEGPWGGSMPNIQEFAFNGGFQGADGFGAIKKYPALYDNFTKVLGTHTMKVGAYWDTEDNVQSSSGPANGTYNFGGGLSTGNVVADLLIGRPANYQQQSSIPTIDLKYHQWSLYAQDSFKANSQLTLNYGIRFDHLGQWYGTQPGLQVWDPTTYDNSAAAPANTGLSWHGKNSAIPVSGWKSPFLYAEPRLGLAYDVTGKGNTVIRGGLALFRYQVSANDSGNVAGGPLGSFTYQTNANFEGYSSMGGFTPPSGVSQSGYLNGASVAAMQQGDNRTPETLDWNLTFSQALPKRTVLEVSYVGNKSSNELINGQNGKYLDINNVLPGAFFRKDPITGQNITPSFPGTSYNTNDFRPYLNYADIYLISHGSYANYNSLQATLNRQSTRFSFVMNYTFSKVMGIWDGNSSNGSGNGTMVDPFHLKANYGPLAYDHTQLLNLTYVWYTPNFFHGNRIIAGAVNGWEMSGYTTLQSGAPLQPNLGGNLNATYPSSLPANDYINLPNGLQANAVNPSTWFGTNAYNLLMPVLACNPAKNLASGQYFNPKCFQAPAQGQQGNLIWPYMRGPAYFDSDLGVYKNFAITETQKIQFRVSATNFLNHPLRQFGLAGNGDQQLSFVNPDGSLSQTNTNTTTTGKPAFIVGARNMQFALKYYF